MRHLQLRVQLGGSAQEGGQLLKAGPRKLAEGALRKAPVVHQRLHQALVT